MQDKKLLIKFSEGNITAVEAKYYKNCLKNMYNKFISKKKCSSWERTIINYRRYLYTIFKFMCTEKVAKCESARFYNSLSK